MERQAPLFSDLLQLPLPVGNLIVEFLSSRNCGLSNVLNLRLVCKTTKSWVDDLPKKTASRVYSRAYVEVNLNTLNEKHVKTLTQFPPPKGISAVYLSVVKVRSRVTEKLILLEKVLDFWYPRLEYLDFEKEGEYLGYIEHENFARLFNGFLAKCQLLKQFNFSIYCLSDFASISPFLSSIKETDSIKINLHFQSKTQLMYMSYIRNSDVGARLRSMIVSIINMASKYKITLIEAEDSYSLLYDLKILLANDVSIFNSFLKLIDDVVTTNTTQVTRFLLECLTSVKYLHFGKNVSSEYINYPSGLITLEVKEGYPQTRMPHTLVNIRLESLRCSAANFHDAMDNLQAECPNLKTLQVNWKVLKYGSQMIERREGYLQGFPNLRSLVLNGSLWAEKYLVVDSKTSVNLVRSTIDNAFPWRQMKLKSLQLSCTFKCPLDMARVVSKNTLSKLASGASGEYLLRLEVPDGCIAMDSLEEFGVLKSLAAANTVKYENTYGRKILWYHPEFLLDAPSSGSKN